MTPAQFTAWFPKGQFGSSGTTYIQPNGTLSSDPKYVQTFCTRSDLYFDQDRWGDFYQEGAAHLIAHLITIDQSEGELTVGQVEANDTTDERIGPISSARNAAAVMAQVRDPFMRTTYGQHYVFLRRQIGLGGMVVLG